MASHLHLTAPSLTRRTLLLDLGTAAAALVVAGCTGSGTDTGTASPDLATDPTGTAGSTTPPAAATAARGDLQFERVLGGAASAYVLVRGGEATIVDTGQSGTAAALADGLEALGVTWDDVSNVVLTHRHPDHVGGLDEVVEQASAATLSAGAGDLEAIPADREVAAVGNGDTVMDLQVHETPGHTPGHVSVFDPASGVLVAGDAINGTEDGGVVGPNPSFTADMDTAWASAATLASLQPRVILFGHGPPATDDPTSGLEAILAEQE